MDWTSVGVGIAVIGFVYGFLHNFRDDIDKRMDKFESKLISIEERMFWMATGKHLEDAILEEQVKKRGK